MKNINQANTTPSTGSTIKEQANTTPSTGSTIKELMTLLKDGEIKDSILSLRTFTGIEIGKDKETQTPVIYLYGTKKEETEEESQNNSDEKIIESILQDLGINFPNHLREATKKPMPIMKLSVPYSNLNDIFTDLVQRYLKANKLSVNAIKGDSEGNFIVMFSNKGVESKFLSDFLKEIDVYKGYTSMDAKNINVARALTNTEIKQIVDILNTRLSSISQDMLSNSNLQKSLKNILDKYTLQFSIDSFIRKDKLNILESAIKEFSSRLKEESQSLKVEPPFKKWTSGEVKEVVKQKKVSTLPVELEVKVIATPLKVLAQNNKQQSQVQTVTESVLNTLGINLPNHLKEADDLISVANNNDVQKKSAKGIYPQKNIPSEQDNSTLLANNVPTVTSTKNSRFDTSRASDATYRTANTPAIVRGQNNQNIRDTRGINTSNIMDATYRDVSPQEDTDESQNNTRVLTLGSIKILRDYFVQYAQSMSFSIKTKENKDLINGLPVVFGNGKDKYLRVDQKGMTGLFTIQVALGEQSTLTNMANWIYKNKDTFTVKNDTSSVGI